MKAKVRYSLGRTINLGNYENAKVEVEVELQCEEDDIDEAYQQVKGIVDSKIEEEVKRWQL